MSTSKSSLIHLSLSRIQQRLSTVELIYRSHPRWPFPVNAQSIARKPDGGKITISILDSSFNPPTKAHLALINSARPPTLGEEQSDYDAKLLLLSVRNADKSGKPGDATYVQRMEMITLLAQEISIYSSCDTNDPSITPDEGLLKSVPSGDASDNVAVAIIDEPTFIGKSAKLLQFLKTFSETSLPRSDIGHDFRLTFVVGTDTLERIFSPMYYDSEAAMLASLTHLLSPQGDDASFVCAQRTEKTIDPVEQDRYLVNAQEFIRTGRIRFIDIGPKERTYSSSLVRAAINEAGLQRNYWRQWVPSRLANYIVKEKLYEVCK